MKRSDKKPRVTAKASVTCLPEGLKHVTAGGMRWSVAPTDPAGTTTVDDGPRDIIWGWG